MIYCENCNALIEENSANCPYCGALNASGSEKHYMEQLYDVKRDVEELADVPAREYRREIGKTGRMIRLTVLAVTVLAAFAGLLFFVSGRLSDSGPTAEELRAQIAWEQEVFPQLDALYAEGDYGGVMECVYENQKASYYSIDNWEHADFVNVYTWYQSCMERLDRAVSGGYDREAADECILDALFLMQERKYDSYTEQEDALIGEYREEVKQRIGEVFGIQEEELTRLYEECCVEDEYGVYFDYQTAKRKIKDFVKEQGKVD